MDIERGNERDSAGDEGALTVGIVCIHGIGNAGTDKGHLPSNVGHALIRGVEKTGGEFRQLSPASTAGADEGPAGNTGADDAPSVRLWINRPDHVPLVVELYDGSWHGQVVPPQYLRVMWWAIRVLPILPLILASNWLQDRMSESNDASLGWGTMIGTLLVFLVGLFAAPVVFLLLALATLVSGFSSGLRRVLRHVVVRILGDAYLYRSGSLEDGGVLDELTTLTRKVTARSQVTMLIGHSQGAEISRRVALLTEVQSCVFVGSGEAPLSMLRILTASPFLTAAMFLMLAPYPLIFVLVVNAMWQAFIGFLIFVLTPSLGLATSVIAPFDAPPLSGPDPLSTMMPLFWQELAALALVAAWMAASALLMRTVSRPPKDLTAIPDASSMYVKSPVDPVSFGSMSEAPVRRYVPISDTPNRSRAVATEHLSYFSKWQTGAFVLEAIYGSEILDLTQFKQPRPFPLWTWVLAALASAGLAALLYWLGTAEGELVRFALDQFTGRD